MNFKRGTNTRGQIGAKTRGGQNKRRISRGGQRMILFGVQQYNFQRNNNDCPALYKQLLSAENQRHKNVKVVG